MSNNFNLLQEILEKICNDSDFNEIKSQFCNLLIVAYLYCYKNKSYKQIVITNNYNEIDTLEELEEILRSYQQIISYPKLKAVINDIHDELSLLVTEKFKLVTDDVELSNQYFYDYLIKIIKQKNSHSTEIDQIISGVLADKMLTSIVISGAHLDSYLTYQNISIVNFPKYSFSEIEYLLAKLFITNKNIMIYSSLLEINSSAQVNIICSRKFFWLATSPEKNFYDSGLNIEEVCSFLTRAQGTSYFYLRQKTWEHESTFTFKQFLIDNNFLMSIIFIRTDRANPWVLLEIAKQNQVKDILILSEDFYTSGAKKTYVNDSTIQQIIHLVKERKISKEAKGIGLVTLETCKQLNYRLDPNALLSFNSHKKSGKEVALHNLSECIFRGPELYQKDLEKIDSNYYMLSQSAISTCDFSIKNMIPIKKELFEANQSAVLKPNDILLLSRSTTNNPAQVPQNIPNCIINLNIICIRPNPQQVNPVYLYLLLQSQYGKSIIANIEKGTVLKSISIIQLKQLIINIANPAAQDKISTRYLELHSKQQEAMYDLQSFLNALNY